MDIRPDWFLFLKTIFFFEKHDKCLKFDSQINTNNTNLSTFSIIVFFITKKSDGFFFMGKEKVTFSSLILCCRKW